MIDEYKKELADLEGRMLKAEEFAAKLPLFADKILRNKTPEDQMWIKFGEKYKDLYCAFGINRGLYTHGTNRTITNYREGPYEKYLFCIYINTLSTYDSHENYGLEEIKDKTPLFFYDDLNSTFYAEDDQIEGLLDALCTWHGNALTQIKADNKKTEIKALKNRLEKLSNE